MPFSESIQGRGFQYGHFCGLSSLAKLQAVRAT